MVWFIACKFAQPGMAKMPCMPQNRFSKDIRVDKNVIETSQGWVSWCVASATNILPHYCLMWKADISIKMIHRVAAKGEARMSGREGRGSYIDASLERLPLWNGFWHAMWISELACTDRLFSNFLTETSQVRIQASHALLKPGISHERLISRFAKLPFLSSNEQYSSIFIIG